VTGPQHYQQAEEYARQAREVMEQIGGLGPIARTEDVLAGSAQVRNLLAAGTLHATLAQAAATIDAGTVVVPSTHQAWTAVLGEESER
jgi:hypothetical protein